MVSESTEPQCNVSLTANDSTIINVDGPLRDTAKIGIWAEPLKNGGDIFGQFTAGNDQNLNVFRNDRTKDESGNPLRGEKADTETKIRWPAGEQEEGIVAPTDFSFHHAQYLILLIFGLLMLLISGGPGRRERMMKIRENASSTSVGTSIERSVRNELDGSASKGHMSESTDANLN